MTRRFLIADDHSIVRSALRTFIDELFPESIIDECACGRACLGLAGCNQYDMLITDLYMPETNAQSMVQQIRQVQPSIKILVFTMLDEAIGAAKYFQMGVDGYLSKDCEEALIPIVIQKMLGNRKYISFRLRDQLLDTRPSLSFKNPFDVLTFREKQVAQLLVKGEETKDIQRRLDMRGSTVDALTTKILEKMKLVSVMELRDCADLYSLN